MGLESSDRFDPGFQENLPLPLSRLYARAFHAKGERDRHDHAFHLVEANLKLAASALAGLRIPPIISVLRIISRISNKCMRNVLSGPMGFIVPISGPLSTAIWTVGFYVTVSPGSDVFWGTSYILFVKRKSKKKIKPLKTMDSK